MVKIDWFKAVWIVAWAAAVARGELPWWAFIALLGFYFTYPYTWLSPKLKKEVEEREAEMRKAYENMAQQAKPREDIWDVPVTTKRRDS